MRILVIADTHGFFQPALEKARTLDDLSLLIHLGDHSEDGEQIARELKIPFRAIKGNCDMASDFPEELRLPVPGNQWFLACHGDRYAVKYGLDRIIYRAIETEVQAVLFAHTHIRCIQWIDGILLLNPGSASLPRDGTRSMALLEIQRNQFETRFVMIDEINS